MGDQAWDAGKISVARSRYEQAVRICKASSPVDVDSVAHGLSMLALFKKYDGDYDAAVAYYAEAIAYLEGELGPCNENTIFALCLQVNCLREMRALDQAEKVARDAVSRAEMEIGPHHRFLGDALLALAEISWDQKRKSEAERYMQAAIAHELALGGRNGGFYGSNLLVLAGWLDSEGIVAEAYAAIREVREIAAETDVFSDEGVAEIKRRYLSIRKKIKENIKLV